MVLEVHTIIATSPNVDELISPVLLLSNVIFDAEPGSKHASLALWKEHLSAPNAVIIYLAPPEHPTEPVAFLFAHPRAFDPPLLDGERASLHIWLAGVLPARRREGCLARLVDALPTVPLLTVATIPGRFTHMWDWLTRRGWRVERALTEGRVLLSKHAI